MFGLSLETALLVFGFPVFWIGYTIVFLVVSRDWDRDDTAGDAFSNDTFSDDTFSDDNSS